MITRKENLLVKPFQRKKFIEHRNKVSKALPRIDDSTPPKRTHVYVKFKKMQTETERHAQIARDNFILLKHLNEIMSAKRVDNIWLYEQPKFLQRVKIFPEHSTKFISNENELENVCYSGKSKKDRCIACHPEKLKKVEIVPEERVPWEVKRINEYYLPKVNIKEEKMEISRNIKVACPSVKKGIKFPDKNKKESKIHKYGVNLNEDIDKADEVKLRKDVKSVPSNGSSANNKTPTSKVTKTLATKETPLTIIMRFPPKVHVTLNAALKENGTEE